MLVLSRRPEEKILLPTVPAVIKIILAQAGLVRLGIEAPVHVPIVRAELSLGVPPAAVLSGGESDEASRPSSRPAFRNRLNNLILGLTLLRMQLVHCDSSVRKTLDGLEAELQALRGHLAASPDDAGLLPDEELAVQARV